MDNEQAFQAVRERLGPKWTLGRVVSELVPGPSEGSPTIRRTMVELERRPTDEPRSPFAYGNDVISVYQGYGDTLEEALTAALGNPGVVHDDGEIRNGDRLRMPPLAPLAESP